MGSRYEDPARQTCWTRALDDRHAAHIAFIDFQKAFDTVPHQRPLHKLRKIGIGESNTHELMYAFYVIAKEEEEEQEEEEQEEEEEKEDELHE
nr:unnamed protein product [Spirometra erinaceieuropaei]